MRTNGRTPPRRRRGFTLLEVLMVIIILGVLAALVVPNFFGAGEDAKKKVTKAAIDSGMNGTLELFRLHVGRYPTTDEGLMALVRKPDSDDVGDKWAGPYVTDPSKLKDGWQRDFIYVSPGQINEHGYDLSSPGSNGRPGDDDDVTNWQRT